MNDRIKNILLIAGVGIGAGIFSLPIALKQSGLPLFIAFVVILGFVMFRINYFLREIVLEYKTKNHIPGYAYKLLGKKSGHLAVWMMLLATFGALIAYAYLGGNFVSELTGVSPGVGAMLFYTIATGVFFFAGSKLEAIDIDATIMKMVLFIVICILFVVNLPAVSTEAIPLTIENPYTAYGVILFAFTSISIIPELHGKRESLSTIMIAQVIILLIYLIFAPLGFFYLKNGVFELPQRAMNVLFQLAGLLAVFTPYQIISFAARDMLKQDLGTNYTTAKGLIAFVPFVVLLFQVGSFISMLSLTGAIFIGGMCLMVTLSYQAVFPHKHFWEIQVIQLLLVIGVIVEVLSFFFFS
ncbi:MAG: aromatic amino acid transport family protein [Patescibacteria group bacterium]